MKKKKNGTPVLGEWDSLLFDWDSYLLQKESRTATFKILVRTLFLV